MTANIIPNIPQQNPGQTPIPLPDVPNPNSGVWWLLRELSNVPENIMGWLVAQGYEVTGIRQDTSTVPPTNYFNVRKLNLSRMALLADMCNNYTEAANTARRANQQRYNEVIGNWTEMINTTHDQFDVQVEEQNTQSAVYLADLNEYMNEIDTLINDNRSQIVADALEAKARLGEMVERLDDLETNSQTTAIAITELLSQQANNLSAYINAYDSKLSELDQNFQLYLSNVLTEISELGNKQSTHFSAYRAEFRTLSDQYKLHATELKDSTERVTNEADTLKSQVDVLISKLELDFSDLEKSLSQLQSSSYSSNVSFASTYDAILALLESDYFAHAPVTQNLLENLGRTETARINESAAASLAVQMQMLVSKGLYMSTIPVDITQRNWRDKDENLQLHNDRLMREKYDNQHRLYEQKFAMRSKFLDGKERINAVNQEVLRYQASLVTSIYSSASDARGRALSGRQAAFAAGDAAARFDSEIISNLYAKMQDVRVRTIESLDRIYQLEDIFIKWKNESTVRRYEQLQQIEAQFIESVQKQQIAKQDANKTGMAEQHTLLSELQNAINALIAGKERYAVALMQNASTLADHKHKAIVEKMNSAVARLEGWKSVAAENTRLMAYQLDERNKLLVGLYAFVERREDVAPEWKDMAQMIAGLGDAGGGWLTPN